METVIVTTKEDLKEMVREAVVQGFSQAVPPAPTKETWSLQDVSEGLKITKYLARNMINESPDFPKPVARGAGKVRQHPKWSAAAVLNWARANGYKV